MALVQPSGEQQADRAQGVQVPDPPAKALPLFFLHTLQVQNFRSLEDVTFTFQPGLNVIIGANNAAKTAVVDALRHVFSLGTYERKDLMRLRPADIFIDEHAPKALQAIIFTATFYGKNDGTVPAQFYDMLCPDEIVEPASGGNEYIVFRLQYRAEFEYNEMRTRYEYLRNDLRGGSKLNNPVSREVLDSIRAIYLAPLRDLVNDKTRVGAEIERLIVSHTPKDKEVDRRGIPEQLKTMARELIEGVTQNKHHVAAGENLALYAKPYQIGTDSLSFEPDGISDGLFSKMSPVFAHALHGNGRLPLGSNGLGINQLIYASIVLSRRGGLGVDDHVRRFFLIEEPEAHLHPQLQDSFFHALNQITDHQLFVTSHSPTITAKTDIDKIIVMRRDTANRTAMPMHLADAFRERDEDKKYLHKFLDVTRSQLLFAQGAVFVEGVTEGMLMQRFSEIINCSLRDAAVEIVVVDSDEGYDHFRPLFDNGEDAFCRSVFITDGDEDPREVHSDEDFIDDCDSALDPGMVIEGSTATATGYGTFEFGLLRASIINGGNASMQQLLRTAMERAAPKSVRNAGEQAAFAKEFLDFGRPSLAYRKMKERRKDTCLVKTDWYNDWHTNDYFKKAKSDFAFHLHDLLADETAARAFIVPKYIKDALRFVVRNERSEEPSRDSDA